MRSGEDSGRPVHAQTRRDRGARRAIRRAMSQYVGMTTQAMAKILESYLEDVEGEKGFWRGTRAEVPVFVFSDDEHDRMRIMAPIGVVEELDPDLLHVLLQANYDRALDARYAMRRNELWSVVVHPLVTLAPDDLPSLFDQVVTLVKNTGTTFASTELVFRALPDDIILEAEDEDGEDLPAGREAKGPRGDEFDEDDADEAESDEDDEKD
jgi:hypothetical protein